MAWEAIKKHAAMAVQPNVLDYEEARRRFSWAAARSELSGLPAGGLNIAHEAIDRHALGELRDKVAIRWLGKDGQVEDFSFDHLRRATNRFANVLERLSIRAGDRVFALTGRIPFLYIAAMGTLKHRSIFCPMFSAFGPEPIKARLRIGQGRVLVTTRDLYEKKIAQQRQALPELEIILLVTESSEPDLGQGVYNLQRLLDEASEEYAIPRTDPEDYALLHFTSGTTGTPKGAIHVHDAVAAHHVTGRLALDLHPDDIFWCTADPGWVTGTSYGIIAPMTNGVTSIVDEADFDASRWYDILQQQKVTVWYTAPTAIRTLMRVGADLAREHDLSSLRFAASVGEPLNPEGVVWGLDAFGLPFHDNWWQTETGGIMIANFVSMEVRPGSMGRPLPGIQAAIVETREDGHVVEITEPNIQGELALLPGWPSMFRGYWNEAERYRKCFADGFYLTGDLARRDADGFYWFIGRKDDVIKTSGHLIGPFEVESVLMEHPAVAEAAVIGKPDPTAMEIIKAFVVLKADRTPDAALTRELLGFGRTRLGSAVAPKEIAFVPALPKTRSGKVLRRLLKARELGLPEGDTSTLEGA